MRLRRILCAAMLPLVSLFWSLSSSAAAGATLDSAEQDLVTRINDFEEFGAGYLSSEYRDALGFLVIIAVLALRPQGFFALKGRIG